MKLIMMLILLGSCLLVLADEKEFIVYVKLALFLTLYGLVLNTFA
ncbi:hypothetical protein [Solibacillus sp. FSL H8-0538]